MADVNIEDLSIEDWRAETLRALTPQEAETPARDDKGRFVAKEESAKAEAEAEVEEVDEVVYRRVIDLGDGSGVQVFEAPSLEDLVDKLAQAQEHATRKIRQDAADKRTQATKTVEEAEGLTEADRFLLSQQILTNPEKVIASFVEKEISKRVAPKLAEFEATAKEQRETKVAVDWVNSNPDYYACERNGKKLQTYLQKMGQEITPETLQAAFEDLNASGLLEAKPTEKQDAKSDAAEAQPERIAPKVETVTKRKVVGGLSTKRQAQVEAKSPEPTEEDLEKLPMADWRAEVRRRLVG